jgi:putative transposon-encoded protein
MARAVKPETTEWTAKGISAVFEKVVTAFGNGAKIDCPKAYLGRRVFVVIRAESNPVQ